MFPRYVLKWPYLLVASLLICSVAQAQEKGLRKFHWGVTSLSASQWIPWIAKETKLYEKYGMDAELVLLRGSGQSAQAIIGGKHSRRPVYADHSHRRQLERRRSCHRGAHRFRRSEQVACAV